MKALWRSIRQYIICEGPKLLDQRCILTSCHRYTAWQWDAAAIMVYVTSIVFIAQFGGRKFLMIAYWLSALIIIILPKALFDKVKTGQYTRVRIVDEHNARRPVRRSFTDYLDARAAIELAGLIAFTGVVVSLCTKNLTPLWVCLTIVLTGALDALMRFLHRRSILRGKIGPPTRADENR